MGLEARVGSRAVGPRAGEPGVIQGVQASWEPGDCQEVLGKLRNPGNPESL